MNESWRYTRQGLLSETLEKHTGEISTPKSDEIVVRIHALSLNPIDYKLATFPGFVRKGLGAGAYGTPRVPCFDFAGAVHVVGSGTGKWKEGDEVFGRITRPSDPGSMQKYVTISSSAVMTRKPSNLSWEQAAAIPLVYMTVYGCLVDIGRLPLRPSALEALDKGKNSVLILGGSGGAGSQAIQLAKYMGLNVVTSCSKASEDLVRKLGADEVIDYRSENVGEVAKRSRYAPFAVVLDCVGGTEVIPCMEDLVLEDPQRPELGVYGSISGDREPLQIASALRHVGRQTLRQIRGSLNPYIPAWIPFRPYIANKRYLFYQSKPTTEMLETVPAFMEHAKEVLVDQVFDFENSKEAFAKLESGRAKGKIVVQIP